MSSRVRADSESFSGLEQSLRRTPRLALRCFDLYPPHPQGSNASNNATLETTDLFKI